MEYRTVVDRAPEAVSSAEPRVLRTAAAVTSSYLAVTLPLALNAVGSGGSALGTAVLHCLALSGLVWAWRRPDAGHWLPSLIADWLPLLAVAFLYSELPTLMLGLGRVAYHDVIVQRWEGSLFGGQPARTLAGALPFAWLSELLHVAYLSYYAIIYLPPLVLYASGRRQAFEQCQTALMLAFTSCFLVFVLFPVEGPRYLWPAPEGVPDGRLRDAVLWVLTRGSSRGTAFPSSHAAVSVAQAVSLWLVGAPPRWLRVAISTLAVLLLVGAVYGGFHYAIDMTVGAVVGALMAWLAAIGVSRATRV